MLAATQIRSRNVKTIQWKCFEGTVFLSPNRKAEKLQAHFRMLVGQFETLYMRLIQADRRAASPPVHDHLPYVVFKMVALISRVTFVDIAWC